MSRVLQFIDEHGDLIIKLEMCLFGVGFLILYVFGEERRGSLEWSYAEILGLGGLVARPVSLSMRIMGVAFLLLVVTLVLSGLAGGDDETEKS